LRLRPEDVAARGGEDLFAERVIAASAAFAMQRSCRREFMDAWRTWWCSAPENYSRGVGEGGM